MTIKFSRSLVGKLKKEVETAHKLNNLRLYKFCQSLLLMAEGYKTEEIAGILNVCVKTVYNWLKEFILKGISCLYLYHYRGRGRPGKITELQQKILYKIIVKGPEKSGYACGGWNTAMIVEVIKKQFKAAYNPRYVSSLLKKMGLSYQKGAFESDHLDEEKRKEWVEKTWPKILRTAKRKKAMIFFCDEVSFAQWGSLGRTWAPIGQQPKIKTTGKRKGLKMFGAIDFFSGAFIYMESDGRFSGDSYIKFLKKLLNKYSDRNIILIEDEAPYHRSAKVNKFKEAMEKEGKLFTYRLPSYSPDYNPIEKLWKNTKRDATHLKYFPTFDDLRSAVTKAFRKFMRDAQKVICVMSKLRKEAGVVNA
jgi:transposase